MATSTFFSFFFLLLLLQQTLAQQNTTGYTCNPSSPTYPCKTYALYTATDPDFLDLAAIGDLFDLSRLTISTTNNITFPNSTLASGQPLYIPLTCSCNPTFNLSFSPVNFTIKSGDTFYILSTLPFQNLTTYQSVQTVNPSLIATKLDVGDITLVPVFCLCPTSTLLANRTNYLLTYVLQPSDNISTLSSRFLVSAESILDFNGFSALPSPYSTLFIPLQELPPLPFSAVAEPPQGTPSPPVQTGGSGGGSGGEVRGLTVGLGGCGVALVAVCLAWGCREGRRKRRGRGDEMEEEVFTGVVKEEEKKGGVLMGVEGCLDKYRVFEMEELSMATEGFHERYVVHGSVYRGSLDGQIFAIKRMKWDACEELKILQKINHGNLVKLEGFSIDPEDSTCYLIYEYIQNGSLHSHLHSKNRNTTKNLNLTWKSRLRIAIDVSNGLQYIHEHTRPRVVHKDIKSSNILLDSSMRAKIANFGLAKSGFNAITTHIVGTQGYIAPEFLSDGVVTTKMDVFAFGVVLLELISGEEAMDSKGRALWTRAAEIWEGNHEDREKKVKKFMDERISTEEFGSVEESVLSVMGVAVGCVEKDPTKRMNMVEIVYTLSKNEDLFSFFSDDLSAVAPATAR